MKSNYLLGVDIGTYASKGVLVDAVTGEVAAEHTIEHGLDMPKPGWAEHDADAVWWGDFCAITHALFEKSGIPADQVRSVGVSALGACTLPVDEDGRPLRKAILYGIDTRAMAEIDELEQRFTREEIFRVSGTQLSSQSVGPKILWLKHHESDVHREARYFLTSQAYLVQRLTGRATLDIFTMGDYTPMGDIRANTWQREMTEYITPMEKLPTPEWSCAPAGKVTRQAADATGLAEGTHVIVGTTDAGAEAVSTGISQPGDLMVMFGSTIFVVVLTDRLLPSPKLWATAWLDDSAYALQGGTSTAGSITRWFRDNLSPLELAAQQQGGENAYAALARLAASSKPGANGLLALPYFEGERTPIYDPQAKGMLAGLTLSHTRGDVYRALLEGIAFGLRHMVDTMRAEGAQPRRIIGAAGGTKNREWMQIVSDVAGIEMTVLDQESSAPVGDAFMAGVGCGLFADLKQNASWVRRTSTITPNASNQAVYETLYPLFLKFYDQSKGVAHALDQLKRV